MLLETVLRASAKLIDSPSRLGDADDGNIQMSSLHHCLQRWENLLVRKIACGAEENE